MTIYDEILNKFRVAARYEIARSDFTLDHAVQKIIEINEVFNPQFIYVDRGFGEYQIEVLHKYGLEHPASGLNRKVKGIHFGSKIDIRDPATKEIESKDVKPFMVNQSVLCLERDQVVLSPYDPTLWQQMMDYRVERITQNGRPVFSSENEHALDAFMLTILAFTIERPDITKILEQFKVARNAQFVAQYNEAKLSGKLFDTSQDPYRKKEERTPEPKDNPNWSMKKVPLGYKPDRISSGFWGTRGSTKGTSAFRRGRF